MGRGGVGQGKGTPVSVRDEQRACEGEEKGSEGGVFLAA